MNTIKQKPYLVQERYIYFQHLQCWQDLRMTFCKESIPCKNKFRAVTNRFCLGDLQVNLRVAETRTSCCMYSEASVSMSWMKLFLFFFCAQICMYVWFLCTCSIVLVGKWRQMNVIKERAGWWCGLYPRSASWSVEKAPLLSPDPL